MGAYMLPTSTTASLDSSPGLSTRKSGVIPGEKQCIALQGMCRDFACTPLDDIIGVCNDKKKCCRKWWIFEPYPTPVPKGKSP
ncbi:beta-defensin 130B [Urocitellus parryii]